MIDIRRGLSAALLAFLVTTTAVLAAGPEAAGIVMKVTGQTTPDLPVRTEIPADVAIKPANLPAGGETRAGLLTLDLSVGGEIAGAELARWCLLEKAGRGTARRQSMRNTTREPPVPGATATKPCSMGSG